MIYEKSCEAVVFTKNQDVIYQKEELSGACLVSYTKAMKLFQFDSSKRILKEATDYLISIKY